MDKDKLIEGFSKLEKKQKIDWINSEFMARPNLSEMVESFWHPDLKKQKVFDEFSENTITNFYFPFGVAPNFLINNRVYCIPMVIEESSVVAAASKAAKFWLSRGGFHTEVRSVEKVGTIYFRYPGAASALKNFFENYSETLTLEASELSANMEERGGGIIDINLIDMNESEANLYKIEVTFNTCNAMGANFINSILECFTEKFKQDVNTGRVLQEGNYPVEIIMSILSNYTPNCSVRAWVECDVDELGEFPGGMSAEVFAEKFLMATKIAQIDPYRATTHNKGIMNGIDSVVMATGNDFRAVEACAHTYASRKGTYSSLSRAEVANGLFKFELEIPMSLGTVGGLTSLHPMAKYSLELLGSPSSDELMQIVATVGLAQNFSAIRSLITTGIQKGHMKMHLLNILKSLGASEDETLRAVDYFKEHKVSFKGVRSFLSERRSYQ
ncbi:MAG: hydroxymethylglutaryl-CoA reductase, degradative [Bacteriovoracaceae bacterium]|jgi:hydroxymethylglutaryl-CoA reductase|nr:hydroxymethylglutaryl-CoA reductase, degradative [Bacteriovoracaceae bacterium]